MPEYETSTRGFRLFMARVTGIVGLVLVVFAIVSALTGRWTTMVLDVLFAVVLLAGYAHQSRHVEDGFHPRRGG